MCSGCTICVCVCLMFQQQQALGGGDPLSTQYFEDFRTQGPALHPINNRIQNRRDHVKQNIRNLSQIWVVWEAMQYDCQKARPEHDEVQDEVAGARLQRPVVQLLALLHPADERYPEIGDGDASDGAAEQQHGEEEPVDVVG